MYSLPTCQQAPEVPWSGPLVLTIILAENMSPLMEGYTKQLLAKAFSIFRTFTSFLSCSNSSISNIRSWRCWWYIKIRFDIQSFFLLPFKMGYIILQSIIIANEVPETWAQLPSGGYEYWTLKSYWALLQNIAFADYLGSISSTLGMYENFRGRKVREQLCFMNYPEYCKILSRPKWEKKGIGH